MKQTQKKSLICDIILKMAKGKEDKSVSSGAGIIDPERSNKIKSFVERWKNNIAESGKASDEKQNTQRFWLDLLESLFNLHVSDEYIKFEDRVELKHTSYIDGYIPKTRVLIEQKSSNVDLSKAKKQSDGEELTPYEQADRYDSKRADNNHVRWIVVCNFREFHVYDRRKVDKERDKPVDIIRLEELETNSHILNFLVDEYQQNIIRETEISVKAGQLVGKLYDALSEQYEKPMSDEDYKSLNRLCVQLVFCLYAEDSELFGEKLAFHDYLKSQKASSVRDRLKDLFKVLNTEEKERDPYMDSDLLDFPYVNGGLFSDENIIIPRFTDEIVEILLDKASAGFDWSEISPTIFGAVFESTLNSETRRKGGMHYTSIENIHKVIDPLFMDALKKEFETIKKIQNKVDKSNQLQEFQEKLASLTFFDPACGSGNFLTETYLSLRRLENDIIRELNLKDIEKGQTLLDTGLIKVSIGQFYGIEINDFAVSVAKTALWIAESQMLIETARIIGKKLARFPLKNYENIIEGNALKIDWESVVSKKELCYIMGNPPFVGYHLQSKEQKEDILSLYVDEKGKPYNMAGKIDYVSGWYFKAAEFMQGTHIRTALVSTNSVTQGEQVAGIWKPLYDRFGIHIDFAHRSFKWDSDSQGKANVHCVIVGFSVAENSNKKIIFDGEERVEAKNINPYLVDADDIFVESRNKPICNVTKMVYGSKPADGGFLFLTPEEYEKIIAKEPNIKKYIRQICGSEEFINNKKRYCLWLVNASPKEIKESKFISSRVESVCQFRLNSPKEATKNSANFSTLFQEIRQPEDGHYLLIPRVSSDQRKYVPIGFMSSNVIASDATQLIPSATLYHFGVLTSDIHMSWMRAVCGRLGSDYRYSKDIVYNNFPWPEPNKEQKTAIEKTAKGILDARADFPDSSLADLYDDISMPPPLRKSHHANDAAVRKAYGFKTNATESEIVARLFELYQEKPAP